VPGLWAWSRRFRDADKAAFHQLRFLLGPYLLQRVALDGNTQGPDQGSQERRVAQMSALGAGNRAATCVISLRLSSAVDTLLRRSAASSGRSLPDGLDWLLRHSFGNCQLLRHLADCPDVWDSKLDARIPTSTFAQLKSATGQLGVSASVYVRKLLYHFYVTKQLKYVGADGHYTLAGRHD
jgi:hypothetical protein